MHRLTRWCQFPLFFFFITPFFGVKQLFKSVINILMVWSKLWRCDLENWWCEQNLDGVNKSFKSVIKMCMVWTKLWRCDLVNWWCEQIFFGVIKCWWCDQTIFRCEQTSIFWKLWFPTVWCDVFTCFFLMSWVVWHMNSSLALWSSWTVIDFVTSSCTRHLRMLLQSSWAMILVGVDSSSPPHLFGKTKMSDAVPFCRLSALLYALVHKDCSWSSSAWLHRTWAAENLNTLTAILWKSSFAVLVSSGWCMRSSRTSLVFLSTRFLVLVVSPSAWQCRPEA